MEAKDTDSKPLTIPDIPGIKQMTPLEMNAVHFDKRHTVLSPALLASLAKKD